MTRTPKKSRGLGRGLSALMSDVAVDEAPQSTPKRPDLMVPIEQIQPNPDQPRRNFDADALEELAKSVGEKGVIQPLIVRRFSGDKKMFEIVAGERRWRAAQIAKLHELPVLVRDYDDTEVLEIAIIENIQRADLNPVDEAVGYKQLMDRFGHTQDKLSQALGKSRSHIANSVRLLTLPSSVQSLLADGRLSAGHARTLVGHPEADRLAAEIVKKGLSVRNAEKLAKAGKAPTTKTSPKTALDKDADTLQIEGDLSAQLGMKVKIDHAAGRENGQVVLHYRDLEQLDDVLRLLSGG